MHPLVMGNWKLNGSIHMVHELIAALRKEISGVAGCECCYCTTNSLSVPSSS